MKILDVELELYGERIDGMHITKGPNGRVEKLDDMAEAWIEGRHDEVYAWIADREARLRNDIVTITTKRVRHRYRGNHIRAWARGRPIVDRERVISLRKNGWRLKQIANEVGHSVSQVSLICREQTLSLESAAISVQCSSPRIDSTETPR